LPVSATRDKPGFDITYNQTLIEEDSTNADLLKWVPRYNRRGLQATFQPDPTTGTQLLTMGPEPPTLGNPSVLFQAPTLNTSACFTGDRSIFSNGGRIYVDVLPIAVIDGPNANFPVSPVLISRDGEGTVESSTWTADAGLPNGWQFEIDTPTGTGISTVTALPAGAIMDPFLGQNVVPTNGGALYTAGMEGVVAQLPISTGVGATYHVLAVDAAANGAATLMKLLQRGSGYVATSPGSNVGLLPHQPPLSSITAEFDILAVSGVAGGTSYTQGEICTLFAVTGVGQSALATATAVAAGAITALTITEGEEGEGYQVGDIVRVLGSVSNSQDALFVVTTTMSTTTYAALLPDGIL
jgi:hypothetical protein